ncbi:MULTISPECIES: hypothetical protein [Amycolatopsis]|uniref:Uncharacterized protein n=1 Tax=Amycolatopsis echigonensis TaxID=2576905 RepID=A0A8E2B3N5_9PSEU|nr:MULTISPECIES: hypothetical protein [Amycolatopsis]MBB2500746.1 hypothetical protein [Amycolatopsis echigonensis]MCG3751296.1 hypothetical protein [Amycolatopsis sp. Poz14]
MRKPAQDPDLEFVFDLGRGIAVTDKNEAWSRIPRRRGSELAGDMRQLVIAGMSQEHHRISRPDDRQSW